MLKSMTAYGRACLESPIGRFIAEIQSVNRKYLEINAILPKELTRFDVEIKKWISAAVTRGQITVKVSAAFSESVNPLVITPNIPLARQLKAAWEKIIQELGLDEAQSFSVEMLRHEQGLMSYGEDLQDEHLYKEALQQVVNEALHQFLAMKNREGTALYDDISSRVELLKMWIKSIAEKAPEAPLKYRQKLMKRLEEILTGSIENEERILREVSIYADRIDIVEETTRFDIHLGQLKDLLNSNGQSVGKTMEFLLQELNREVNTIGSKSSDVEVSHLVVSIKSELERIREQIQNIE